MSNTEFQIHKFQTIDIYPHQSRTRAGTEKLLNQPALYQLYRQTLHGSPELYSPFRIIFCLGEGPELTGFMKPYPHTHYQTPWYRRYKGKLPMTGAMIGVDTSTVEAVIFDIPSSLNQTRIVKYNPTLMAANLIFLHEWGHVIQLARDGFDPRLFSARKKAVRLALDENCEEFAQRQLEFIILNKKPLVVSSL